MQGLKSAIWQFSRKRLIGWIGHALLVQPSISAHWKWPEMVVSASTNQLWIKMTIRTYAWSLCLSDPDPSSVNTPAVAEKIKDNIHGDWSQSFPPQIKGFNSGKNRNCGSHLIACQISPAHSQIAPTILIVLIFCVKNIH